MTTGEKLQQLRKEKNYTQEELADIMNVSRQSISKWESDVAFPETEKLIALSKLYNCSIDYLLKEESENRGDGVVAISKKEAKYNKKRLPLILSTIATYVISLFLYIPVWFSVYTAPYVRIPVDGGGYYYKEVGSPRMVEVSPYSLFSLVGDPYTNGQALKAFAIILFVLAACIIHVAFVYLFLDKKPFKIIVRIANSVYFVCFAIFLILALSWGWSAFPIIALALSAILVIVQYAVKPIRVTR